MGILDKAKSIAQQEKDKHQQELARERKEREDKENLVNAVKLRTRTLIGELDGKEGFTVNFNGLSDQHVATLSHKGSAIGCIVVLGETYQFVGSDECPNETAWHVKIAYCKTPQLWREPMTYVGVNYEGYIDKELEKFSDQLATHLKRYF